MTDDPFAFDEDDDRTVLRSRGANSAPSGRAVFPPQPVGQVQELPTLGGINKLEKAASRLLPLLLTMKHSTSPPDPEQLRNKIIQELNLFKRSALDILGDPKKVTQASYVMCTALDEAAMNTPWGHQSNWAQHNLLSTFHNEVIGGERFFALLKRLGRNPAENIDLLELMYVCLSLGYEGAYRIAQNGQNTLVKVRAWLFEIICSVRSTPESALSVQWQGSGIQESKLPKMSVIWVVAAAALTLSSLAYLGYRYNLGSNTEIAVAGFYSIKAEPLTVSSIAPPLTPPPSSSVAQQPLSLQQLLQPQIDTGLVEVTDSFNEGNVRILGNNLFASGRAEFNPELTLLIGSIVQALEQFKGAIVVTGHSDNIPIRSGRFASNLELSQARANSVARIISAGMADSSRVSAAGRGSLEPIAENSSSSGRAKNRRVEVSIFY